MLNDFLTKDRVRFTAEHDWRTAIRTAAGPLLTSGSIRESYVDKILENIAAPNGTYMDLGFGITLAHARPEAGVHETGLSLLVLDDPIDLADDEGHPMKLIFVLAAVDTDTHQATMAELARLLVDADARAQLTAAASYEDVLKAIEISNP